MNSSPPKKKRYFRRAAMILAGLILSAFLTVYYMLILSAPSYEGEISLPELTNAVEITFDSMGLPQIWAETDHDGYFALGYLHATDRLFQIDLIRHVAQGRVSELIGKVTIDEDMRQRAIGHTRIAQKALPLLSDKNRARLQAYADGINAYARECAAYPFEFYILQFDFEDWTVYDCLCILSFQTWFSDALVNRDIFHLKTVEKVGLEKASSLLPNYPEWAPATVEHEGYGSRDQTEQESPVDGLPAILSEYLFSDGKQPFLLTESSNAWAVSGSRSKSGRALFASDPHLDVTRLPQFWYFVGLHIEESGTDVLGIGTPGLPFIVMGHNGAVAFAFTAAGVDNSDYYIERINPDDSNQYETEDGWRSFERRYDTVYVRRSDPVAIETKVTRHGPIIPESDSTAEGDSLKQTYAFKWTGFDADLNLAVSSGFDLHRVADFAQFQKIVTTLGALNANWLYADSSGNIGYQLGTPLPIRRPENKNLPLPGWTGEYEWEGYYPLEQTPRELNPRQGWVGNCNNIPVRGSVSYELPGNYFVDRILRLDSLMTTREKFDLSDLGRFQLDRTDLYLLRWRDILVPLLDEGGDSDMAEQFRRWSGTTSEDSKETLLIELFLSRLIALTFSDELGERASQVRVIWMDQIYHSDDTVWFDNITSPDKVETRDEITRQALTEALALAADQSWGERHTLTMRHPMAAVPILGSLLNLSYGPWPRGGTAGTLNASFFTMTDQDEFKTFVAPSWRFLIDFADIDGASVVFPAGNSGNPMSEHFFNFNELWRSGQRWKVPFHYEKVRSAAASTLNLVAEIP